MATKELESGKLLGNYQIVSTLGRGGMATVYKSHDVSLNREVALKVLSSILSEDTDYIKRFQREAQAAAQLNHPNIVHIYAIGEMEGHHYFAMEYIKGESLSDVKKEGGKLAPEKAVPLIIQVAEALGEAHRAGLVHRDIKPSNIMVNEAGLAKVTDFGIAYVVNAQTKLTRDGSIIGTPEYLSPEQCEGKPVDQRSDIYSLGVTLYELLSGKTPYDANTPVSMIMKIAKGDFRPIQEISPEVPAPLRGIIEKMMQLDVEKRYANMGEVAAALRGYQTTPEVKPASEVPVEKARLTMTYQEIEAGKSVQTGKKGSKSAALIVAAVIVILMGGAFAAKLLYFDKKATPTTTQSATQEVKATDAAQSQTGAASDSTQPQTAATPTTEETQTQTSSSIAGQNETPGESQINTAEASSTTTAGSTSMRTSLIGQTQASRITTPAAPKVASNSCAITAYGNSDKTSIVIPYVHEMLARKKFQVVEGPDDPNANLSGVARTQIVVNVNDMGSNTLSYYGSTTEQYSVQITLKALDTGTKKIVGGPITRIVKYTHLNAGENLKGAIAEMISGLRLK